MDELFEHEVQIEKVRNENKVLLKGFEQWLQESGFGKKTIRNHLFNAEFYINDFLLYYEPVKAREGIEEVSNFFDDWFIRKAMWSNKASVLSNITSLKKFYQYLVEIGEIQGIDSEMLKRRIKEEKADWVEAVEAYNDFD
ncbi:recombinase [Isachenkonia alkalipeptolytica]|uniref:Recombinase n=1 Tax=Isachenkonia alkalipeptolytica TaxID=2565777 RepID=A0AA44BCB9_9CLOT|nr:recombinase [Isachenkonia alkalipeptolytica]NBG87224.1 recombinase [Isachenkonia alkalipeptolytica]